MKRKQMATVLQKPIIILALLLVNSMLFPQNNHNNFTPWCIKPYYGKQYDKELDHNYSCIGLEAFFFLSQSINVGAFVNGGTFKYSMTFYEDNNFILYDGECRDLFWKYDINTNKYYRSHAYGGAHMDRKKNNQQSQITTDVLVAMKVSTTPRASEPNKSSSCIVFFGRRIIVCKTSLADLCFLISASAPLRESAK